MRTCSGRLAGLACALVALALSSPAPSVAAPASAGPASKLGPEVKVSKPRDGYVGRMDVSP